MIYRVLLIYIWKYTRRWLFKLKNLIVCQLCRISNYNRDVRKSTLQILIRRGSRLLVLLLLVLMLLLLLSSLLLLLLCSSPRLKTSSLPRTTPCSRASYTTRNNLGTTVLDYRSCSYAIIICFPVPYLDVCAGGRLILADEVAHNGNSHLFQSLSGANLTEGGNDRTLTQRLRTCGPKDGTYPGGSG